MVDNQLRKLLRGIGFAPWLPQTLKNMQIRDHVQLRPVYFIAANDSQMYASENANTNSDLPVPCFFASVAGPQQRPLGAVFPNTCVLSPIRFRACDGSQGLTALRTKVM